MHAEFQGGGCAGRAVLAISCSATKQWSSKHSAHGLPNFYADIAVLPNIACLACMPIFQAGVALGGQGQPGVNLTGSRQP
eukprot:1157845-Pelagomonas_calceolata.AAC.11